MGFVDGVMHDSSCASNFTFDESFEFTVKSLDHFDVSELILRAMLDCIWNGRIADGA